MTLIGLSRFVIADLSGARDYRLELEVIAPGLSGAPVQPLLADSDTDAVLMDNIRNNPHFLNVFTYSDEEDLLASLSTKVGGRSATHHILHGQSDFCQRVGLEHRV